MKSTYQTDIFHHPALEDTSRSTAHWTVRSSCQLQGTAGRRSYKQLSYKPSHRNLHLNHQYTLYNSRSIFKVGLTITIIIKI